MTYGACILKPWSWHLVDSFKAVFCILMLQLKRVIDELCENIDTSHKTSNSKRKALSETKTNNSEKKAAIVSDTRWV